MAVRGSSDWPVIEPDASFLSAPRASSKRLAMFVECGKRGAQSTETIDLIIGVYVATCDAAEIDPLLVVSQLILETDNLTAGRALARPLDPVRIAATREHTG